MGTQKKQNSEKYCRACGTGKGHTFTECTNASGLRTIIRQQDETLSGSLERTNRLEAELKMANDIKSTNELLTRILHALLTLVEIRKA